MQLNEKSSFSVEIIYANRYKQIKQIGTGSNGIVYLIEDLKNKNKKLALKMLTTDKINKSEEIQIMLKLTCPFIVSLVDSFKSGMMTCLVIDYCESGDLKKTISNCKKLRENFTFNLIYRWSCEMIRAISYLHDNKLIHRDIKPENVFLTGDNHVKLGDLGEAKEFNKYDIINFYDGTLAGTYKYMSPEMKRQKTYSYQTDVWSTGCIIFELITLEMFVDHNDPFSVVNNLKNLYQKSDINCVNILKNLLKTMLIENPCIRASSNQLLTELTKDSPKIKLTNPIHMGAITCLVSIDEKLIASGSEDKTIKIWNLSDGKVIRNLNGHTDSVLCLTRISIEKIASGSKDTTIKIWNTENGLILKTLTGHVYDVNSICLLNNSLIISVSEDKTIRVWNTDNEYNDEKLINYWSGHSRAITSLVNISNEYFATCSVDKTIKIWNISSFTLNKSLNGHKDRINSLVVLSNDNFLASASNDISILIWNINSGCLVKSLLGHSWYVTALTPLPNCFLASGSGDNTIKIWDTTKGSIVSSVKAHTNTIYSLLFLSDDYLASGGCDKLVKIWKI